MMEAKPEMTLDKFGVSLMEKTSHSHPFVCSDSPFDTLVAIVGINPARHTGKSFITYWDKRVGFNRMKLVQDLLDLEGKLTPTRKRIETIAAAIAQRAGRDITLDTNIYSPASPRARGLTDEEKGTEVFEFLMCTIRPPVVLAHGDESYEIFENYCDDISGRGVTKKARWGSWKFALVRSCHLSSNKIDTEKTCRDLMRALRFD
jgi:hypothetical protein